MNAHQLRRLDQALVSLLDERARLVRAAGGSLRAPSHADILRRYDGPLDAQALSAVLDAINRACGLGDPAGGDDPRAPQRAEVSP